MQVPCASGGAKKQKSKGMDTEERQRSQPSMQLQLRKTEETGMGGTDGKTNRKTAIDNDIGMPSFQKELKLPGSA